MGQIEFGKDQLNAINLAYNWYTSDLIFSDPIFVIGGYAGTGKSTVLSTVLMKMNIPKYKVAYVTYTGKAAVVLRRKGSNAFTIHKLIYNTSISKTTNQPIFRKKPHIPANIEIICIDELGMVPQQIMEDLLSYKIPILALGDPGQLPPIYGENKYIQNPNCFLSEVFRQSSDSSLLKFATDIRNNEYTKDSKYGSDVTICDLKDFKIDNILYYDQIICSMNINRININIQYRKLLNKLTPLPTKGEKVICQMNNFKDEYQCDGVSIYLVNGLTGILVEDSIQINEKILFFKFKPDGMNCIIPVFSKVKSFTNNYENFGNAKIENNESKEVEFYENSVINDFDYGYCITCHKSQGSEWDNVMVYNDCFYRNKNDYLRWLYTAVTRAKKSITVVNTLM